MFPFESYPLVNLPLPGNAPVKYSSPFTEYAGMAPTPEFKADNPEDLVIPIWVRIVHILYE